MPDRGDPARDRDPFDFREPPAPVEANRPADPAGPAPSPFAFPGDGDRGRRGGRARWRELRRELRAAGLASPGAVAVGLALLVVVVLLVAAVVALL